MADRQADDHGAAQQDEAAALPGTFEELLDLVAKLDEDGPAPFHDRAFSLTQEQFLHFLELREELPYKLGRIDWDGETLRFKYMGLIHGEITGLLIMELCVQLHSLVTHPEVGPLAVKLRPLGSRPISRADMTSYQEPDFTFGRGNVRLPAMVCEVSYGRAFSEKTLVAKYRDTYLGEHGGDIRTVVCVKLYRGRGSQRYHKTATKLDRSTISVWTVRRGEVVTAMDWVPLS